MASGVISSSGHCKFDDREHVELFVFFFSLLLFDFLVCTLKTMCQDVLYLAWL
jgi:hypothetical protein